MCYHLLVALSLVAACHAAMRAVLEPFSVVSKTSDIGGGIGNTANVVWDSATQAKHANLKWLQSIDPNNPYVIAQSPSRELAQPGRKLLEKPEALGEGKVNPAKITNSLDSLRTLQDPKHPAFQIPTKQRTPTSEPIMRTQQPVQKLGKESETALQTPENSAVINADQSKYQGIGSNNRYSVLSDLDDSSNLNNVRVPFQRAAGQRKTNPTGDILGPGRLRTGSMNEGSEALLETSQSSALPKTQQKTRQGFRDIDVKKIPVYQTTTDVQGRLGRAAAVANMKPSPGTLTTGTTVNQGSRKLLGDLGTSESVSLGTRPIPNLGPTVPGTRPIPASKYNVPGSRPIPIQSKH